MKTTSNKKGSVAVEPEDIMPLFGELFTRTSIKELLEEVQPGQTMYWRILTPLMVLWGFIYQRVNRDHTCDAYVSHLRSGGADLLDKEDTHSEPLSKRLRSESNAGYVQGRQRLPLSLLQGAQQRVALEAQRMAGDRGRWHGLLVRLLDGTTFTMPPEGDLPETYRIVHNNHGPVHWIKVRAVLACDYFTQAVIGLTEMTFYSSERQMVPEVVGQDPEPGSLYMADQNFGIYSVLQAITAHGHHVLLRLTKERAQALRKRQRDSRPLSSGESRLVVWQPTRHDQVFEQWPAEPIQGRLLYVHIAEKGYRPTDLYLFTTLLDEEAFPTLELCALYRQRWRVEVHFRHVKHSLEMDFFPVQSAATFRKELLAGILTYNLICILMLQAALRVQLLPVHLSFKRCMRRVHTALATGVPAWVKEEGRVADHLLTQLSNCRLPKQPNKVKHEPRKVRERPSEYPPLRGDRNEARQTVLKNIKEDPKS